MDERSGHFFVSVGRICEDAAVAKLPVWVRTASGESLDGVPDPPRPALERALDHTGYEDGLRVGDRELALHDIVEITLRRPAPTGD